MDHSDYDKFADACVEALKTLQDRFQHQYNIDWYENWFYNQSTGLLTFSTGDKEMNFKYFAAGSFSVPSNTWKWSWDNETTLDKVKQQIYTLKEFGLKNNFPKLTTGYFQSNEFEAWEFTAIAAALTNAIGVYRPVSDRQLQHYLILTAFIDHETAKKIKDKYVQCEYHEFRRAAFVCQHLNHQNKVGFHEAFETFEDMELSDDDDFQAWCDVCEGVRQEHGAWNDRSMAFAGITVICAKCYFEMKELNLGHR